MTLLVAGTCENSAWIVADTAITAETMQTRSREYMIKVEPVQESALIGFANVPSTATRAIRAAANKKQGRETVDFLLREHLNGQHADFIYIYLEDDVPHLYSIKDGAATRTQVAYIGSHEAFAAFQEIKHAQSIDPSPDAMHMFVAGHRGTGGSLGESDDQLHTDVTAAILAMQALFNKTSDRGVGGTAVPFIVSSSGALLYNYGYSVTDPGINALKPGSLVRHGTPQLGGFGISVTELREGDGVVVYWLQRPGGIVWLKAADWYKAHKFDGSPSQFIAAVKATLGRDVDIWFGEEELGTPESVRVLYDQVGRPRLMMAESQRTLSFSWMQGSDDDFSISSKELRIGDTTNPKNADPIQDVLLKVDDGGTTATLSLMAADGVKSSVQLPASAIDNLIRALARARAEMSPPVQSELKKGEPIDAQIDPMWRTRPMLHPSIPGELLILRHRGLGWLGFVLPPHEVVALGEYLLESSKS